MTAVTEPTTATTPNPYVTAVAAALDRAGVADPERQELLDDLTGHLAELEAEAEADDALVAHLGPPAEYASELLASAGIATADAEGDRSTTPWWRRAAAAARRELAGPRVAAVRAFLPELRPGWWVLRGWAVVAWYTKAVRGGAEVFPLPKPSGAVLLSYLLLAAAVAGSVWLGRRPGWVDRAATVLGVVAVVVALNVDLPDASDSSYDDVPTGVLVTPDARVVTNIWPFDADGNPLDGVLLFDQDGRPIDLGEVVNPYSLPGRYPQEQTTWAYDPATGAEHEVPATLPSIAFPGRSEPTTTTTTSTTTAMTTPPGS